jgi:hypothetical protein
MKKQWTKQEIVDLLTVNDKAVARACVRLFERQTNDERNHEATIHGNGIGFNKVDAKFLSSVAQFYTQNGSITRTQVLVARKKIVKYARQLVEIANSK